MNPEYFAFGAVFSSLLGTPILAPVLSWTIARKSKQTQRRLFVSLVTFTLIAIIAKVFGVSLRSYEANATVISIAFVCYGVIAFSIFRLKPRALGIVLGSVASLPLVIGVLLGTVGILFMLFVVDETVPVHSSSNGDGLSCQVTRFGNVTTSDEGYDVVLTKSVPVISFIEYRVNTQTLHNPNFPPAEACDKVVYPK